MSWMCSVCGSRVSEALAVCDVCGVAAAGASPASPPVAAPAPPETPALTPPQESPPVAAPEPPPLLASEPPPADASKAAVLEAFAPTNPEVSPAGAPPPVEAPPPAPAAPPPPARPVHVPSLMGLIFVILAYVTGIGVLTLGFRGCDTKEEAHASGQNALHAAGVALVLNLLAIVFGAIGMGSRKTAGRTGTRAMAISAFVSGLVGLLGVAGLVVLAAVFDSCADCNAGCGR